MTRERERRDAAGRAFTRWCTILILIACVAAFGGLSSSAQQGDRWDNQRNAGSSDAGPPGRWRTARRDEQLTAEQQKEIASERRSQVGSGDRSEKIRTYNFQQNLVTDHRIGLTIHRLQEFLDGDIAEMLNALLADHQAKRLADRDGAAVAPPAA